MYRSPIPPGHLPPLEPSALYDYFPSVSLLRHLLNGHAACVHTQLTRHLYHPTTEVGFLDSLSSTDFPTLGHPHHPNSG